MKAVVLVGGEGTRLRPLTLTTPKAMLPVANVPMIERILGHLHRHGVDHAVLSMGYRPDAFIDRYPDGQCAGVALEYAVEMEPLDTAGAVRFAAAEAGVSGTFLVVNGDVLTDLDVEKLMRFHADRGAAATISLTPVDDPSRFGVVPTDADGRVLDFIEKPPRDEAPTNLINAGFYVLEASVLDRIPPGRRVSIERETFPAMVEAGTLYALASDAYWIETGNHPLAYLQANLDMAERDGGDPDAGVIGAGARVDAGACVRRSVVFSGAVVAGGAQVTNSIVGSHAVVGEGAVLDRAVVGDGAFVPPNTQLVDARLPDE